MSEFRIKFINEKARSFYTNDKGLFCHGNYHEGDSGLDLFVTEDILIRPGETKTINCGFAGEMIENGKSVSYYLFPRSSISKTQLIMANSIGIIDGGYRGEIKAVVRYLLNNSESSKDDDYIIEKGTRLFQICTRNLEPLSKVTIVNNLSETSRGIGGFGSTG